MDQILNEDQLPIKMAGFGHCFRTEAGAGGKTYSCELELPAGTPNTGTDFPFCLEAHCGMHETHGAAQAHSCLFLVCQIAGLCHD